jgi:hypothetical protein
MTIKRKKKKCKDCNEMQYLWAYNRCKRCDAIHKASTQKPKEKKTYTIPSVSKTQLKRLAEYRKQRKDFMSKHEKCQVCRVKDATEVHHKAGRVGDNLTNQNDFLAVCRGCHRKIEENPKWAKENGYSTNRL